MEYKNSERRWTLKYHLTNSHLLSFSRAVKEVTKCLRKQSLPKFHIKTQCKTYWKCQKMCLKSVLLSCVCVLSHGLHLIFFLRILIFISPMETVYWKSHCLHILEAWIVHQPSCYTSLSGPFWAQSLSCQPCIYKSEMAELLIFKPLPSLVSLVGER